MINVFINVLFPVLFIFTAGYIIGKIFPLDKKAFSVISIYILTPALVFAALYEYRGFFSFSTLQIFIAVTIVIFLTIAVIEILDKIFHFEKSFKVVLTLTLILTNSGNFGLPITEYAFGEEGLAIGTLVMVIYIIYTHTVGVFVAASDKSSKKKAFIQMLKIPVFYAFTAALLLNLFKVVIPEPVLIPIKSLGYSGIPLNLLFVGITLSDIRIDKKFLSVAVISMLKLIIIPLAAYFILVLLNIKGIDLKVTLVQIAMPSAIYCSILASYFDSDVKLASEVILVSLLFSIISLSGIIYVLKWI